MPGSVEQARAPTVIILPYAHKSYVLFYCDRVKSSQASQTHLLVERSVDQQHGICHLPWLMQLDCF